jgi:hypothetical protein
LNNVTCSANGQYVYASTNGGLLHYSIDFGSTWNQNTAYSKNWTGITCSANGQYVYACTNGEYLYYSSNFGSTWTQVTTVGSTNPFTGNWIGITCSANGQYVYAIINNTSANDNTDYFYFSQNFGSTWDRVSSNTTDAIWYGITCSANGQYIYACGTSSGSTLSIRQSKDFCISVRNIQNAKDYRGITCSANGQYVYAYTSSNGGLFYSSDYASTMTQSTTPTISQTISGITCSANGQYVVASTNGEKLYYSTNFGVNFTSFNSSNNWKSIKISNDGQYIYTCSNIQIFDSITTYDILNTNANIVITNAISAAAYYTTSDYRIKSNVVQLDNTYTVDNLKPVKYTINNKEDIGFIAHEIQEIYPFMVNYDKDDTNYQSVNYNQIICILTKEIKDLKKEISLIETNIYQNNNS